MERRLASSDAAQGDLAGCSRGRWKGQNTGNTGDFRSVHVGELYGSFTEVWGTFEGKILGHLGTVGLSGTSSTTEV